MEEGFVKIRLTSEDGMVETLWAVPAGEGRFELRNAPFFAYGISDNDIVEALEYAPSMYEFVRVAEPSGNRALRMILAEGGTAETAVGKAILAGLNAVGCNYEGMNDSLIAVVVPPDVELRRVVDYLVDTGLTWEYANPTYEELFG